MPSFMPPLYSHSSTPPHNAYSVPDYCFLFFTITQKHKTIYAVSFSPFYLKYPKSHSISVHSLFKYNLLNQFSYEQVRHFSLCYETINNSTVNHIIYKFCKF